MINNKLFYYLTLRMNYESQPSKYGGQSQYTMLPLDRTYNVIEHHFSIYETIETNNIAYKSQYHYTATLENGKVRIYFDDEDKICGVKVEGDYEVADFETSALEYAQLHVVPLKKSMTVTIEEDKAYLNQTLSQLNTLSIGFPKTLTQWQQLSKELLHHFSDKECYHNDGTLSQLSFLQSFSVASQLPSSPKRTTSSSSIEEAGSPIREISNGAFEPMEPVCTRESTEQLLAEDFLEIICTLESASSRAIDMLISDFKKITDVSLLLDKKHCEMINPACFESLYQKIGLLASPQLDLAIKNKDVKLIKHFAAQVNLAEIGYKPKTLQFLMTKKDAELNTSILEILANAKVFNIKQYRLVYKGTNCTLLQYAYLRKNKELFLFVLKNGGSLLDEHTNGLPIFQDLFYSQENPCREVIMLPEIRKTLTASFYSKVCELLKNKGVEDSMLQGLAEIAPSNTIEAIQLLKLQSYSRQLSSNIGSVVKTEALLSDPRIVKMYKEVAEIEMTSLKSLTSSQRKQYMQLAVAGSKLIAEQSYPQDILKLLTGYEFHKLITSCLMRCTKATVACIKLNIYNKDKGMFLAQPRNKKQVHAVNEFKRANTEAQETVQSYIKSKMKFTGMGDMLSSFHNILDNVKKSLEGMDEQARQLTALAEEATSHPAGEPVAEIPDQCEESKIVEQIDETLEGLSTLANQISLFIPEAKSSTNTPEQCSSAGLKQ